MFGHTVILQIFGVVLFSVVNGFTESKKTPKWENTFSGHDSIHGHRNLNETERSVIARYRNFNAPKICKITVPHDHTCTAWCSEIGSLTSLDAPELHVHAFSDVGELISLHQAVIAQMLDSVDLVEERKWLPGASTWRILVKCEEKRRKSPTWRFALGFQVHQRQTDSSKLLVFWNLNTDTHYIIIPKTIGNRKRDCAWGGSGW